MRRVRVALTGATGALGKLLLPELQQSGEFDLLAGWHRQPPTNDHIRWTPFDLARPEPFLEKAMTACDSLVFLHLACTISNRYREVLDIDCRGAQRIIDALDSNSVSTWVVFASSIEATETSPYGQGKAYVEQVLHERKRPGLHPTSVRIPVVGRRSRVPDAMPPEEFAGAFFRRTAFWENLKKMKMGCLPDMPSTRLYLVGHESGG